MPRFEKYKSATDGKWWVVTVPDDWKGDAQVAGVLSAPRGTDRYFDSEEEADTEIRRRIASLLDRKE